MFLVYLIKLGTTYKCAQVKGYNKIFKDRLNDLIDIFIGSELHHFKIFFIYQYIQKQILEHIEYMWAIDMPADICQLYLWA